MQPSAWESAKDLPGSPGRADSSGEPAGMGVSAGHREGNRILVGFAGRLCLTRYPPGPVWAGGLGCTGCTGLLAGGTGGSAGGNWEPLAVPYKPGWGERRVIAMETDEGGGTDCCGIQLGGLWRHPMVTGGGDGDPWGGLMSQSRAEPHCIPHVGYQGPNWSNQFPK